MSKRNTLTISYKTKDRVWLETLYVIENEPTKFVILDFYQMKTNPDSDIVVKKKVSLKFIKSIDRCGSVYNRYGVNKIFFTEDNITLDTLVGRVFGDYIEEINKDTRNKVYESLKKQLKIKKTAEKWKIIKKLFKRI